MVELKSILIADSNLNEDLVQSLPYPAVIKSTLSGMPRFAAFADVPGGSSDSHEMAILFSGTKLKDFRRPALVQEFLNHNGIIFKIFVIGDELIIQTKPSLPNYEANNDREPLPFNSQVIILGYLIVC